MFDTHILATSGTVIDFDCTAPLMDKDLLQQARDAMRDERDNRPRSEIAYSAQWLWDYYCERHYERHGDWFGPDVIPGWHNFPMPAGPTEPPLP
jgi:hypothetical protein